MVLLAFLLFEILCTSALVSEGEWITDRSEGLSANGNRVEMVKPRISQSMHYNAIWKNGNGDTTGKRYWKISLKDLSREGASVGLTDLDNFKQGWEFSGFMYNGNLGNGRNLLVSDFGPKPMSGDTVGILASFEENNLKVYLDINGSPLGLAFDVPKSILKSVFPAISFSGAGLATIEEVSTIPIDITRTKEEFTGKEGNWRLQIGELKIDGEGVTRGGAVLKIKKIGVGPNNTEKYKIDLKVINNMWLALEKEDDHEEWKTRWGVSTRIGGTKDRMMFERQIKNLLTNPTTFDIDGSYLIINNVPASMESKWERYAIEPVAFKGIGFH